MQRTLRQMAVKITVALLVAPMGAYLGLLAWMLTTHLLFALSSTSMIVLHIFGIDLKSLQFLTMTFDLARSNQTALYGSAIAGFCGAGALALSLPAPESTKSAGLLIPVIMAALCVAGGVADFHYGITPLSELSFGESAYNASTTPVEHHFLVENIMSLPDRLSGASAEVDGILDYQPQMKRFVLRSTATEGNYVNVFFFKNRRTLFSGTKREERPRYFERVEPFIGKRVRILGKCVSGQIDADIANVRELAAAPDVPPDSKPVAPL
jgi:hypothetical protein